MVAVLRLEGVIGGRGRRGLTLAALCRRDRARLPLRNLEGRGARHQLAGRLAGAVAAASIAASASSPRSSGVPVFAFAEDVAASGGYWLALAADEIYAEETSLVGSIGVVTAGFGFAAGAGAARRRAAPPHRRARTSRCSIRSCPRSRATSSGSATCSATCTRASRRWSARAAAPGSRARTRRCCRGEIFTGRRALASGLIDGIGDLRGVMRAALRRAGPAARRSSRAPALRPVAAAPASRARCRRSRGDSSPGVEERVIWARFGLWNAVIASARNLREPRRRREDASLRSHAAPVIDERFLTLDRARAYTTPW